MCEWERKRRNQRWKEGRGWLRFEAAAISALFKITHGEKYTIQLYGAILQSNQDSGVQLARMEGTFWFSDDDYLPANPWIEKRVEEIKVREIERNNLGHHSGETVQGEVVYRRRTEKSREEAKEPLSRTLTRSKLIWMEAATWNIDRWHDGWCSRCCLLVLSVL